MNTFDQYPYTNFHEMNDDWIIWIIKELESQFNDFVVMNSLTYADPINYDPLTTYAKNTVVVYQRVAYVSKRTAPAGTLPATFPDYWLKIFPFGDLIEEGIYYGITVMNARVTEFINSAQNQINTAIAAIPGEVDDWLAAHPEATTTVQDGAVSFRKLDNELQSILLSAYQSDGVHSIDGWEQGTFNTSTGAKIASTSTCRTNRARSFDDGVVIVAAAQGCHLSMFKYSGDTFIGVELSNVGTTAVAFEASAEYQYTFTITMDGHSSALLPSDLPDFAAIYFAYTPIYDELSQDLETTMNSVFGHETVTLADVFATASSNTLNVSLGVTVPGNTVCTVRVTASAVNASNDSTLIWRGPSGNINTIGILPQDTLSAVFTNTAPTSNAGSIRINQAVSGATYHIVVTTENVIDNVAELTTICNGIGEKTPIADVMSFRTGYWQSVTTFSTGAAYRVGASACSFDKDVVISAFNGYWLAGYIDGVQIGNVGAVAVPANKTLQLYIRKVWENTSTPVTVAEMTDDVYILNLNKLTEYDRLLDTFAGIEMFRTAGFVGDSYVATRLGHSWVDIVQGRTGVECAKFAKSGDDSGAWLSDQNNGLPALEAAAAKDLYWIALGINDGDRVDRNSSYLGSISDISGAYTSYPDTFYGNYGHIIEAIAAHAPNAKIVLYKPVYRSQPRTLWGVSSTQNGIKQVRDAIDEIALHYDLPVMDALDDLLFRSQWYATHMDSAVSAGTHPAVMLYPAIAAANMRLFSKMVQHYDAYFMNLNYDT